MVRDLFQRSSLYFMGLTLGKGISTLVVILFAKVLLPEKFGQMVLFVTLVQIITVFGDFGLNQWYQKNVENSTPQKTFAKVLRARVFSFIISVIFSGVFLYLGKSLPLFTAVLTLLTLIPEALLSIGDGFYLEQKQSSKVSLKNAVKMFLLLIGYVFCYKFITLELSVIMFFVSSVLTMIWYFPWKLLKNISYFNVSESIKVLGSSKAYALLTLTSFTYARGDSLIVNHFLGNTALGIYNGAYRFLEGFSLLPTAIGHNLFPLSARKGGVNSQQVLKIFSVMTLLGFAISAIVFLLSESIILGLLGPAFNEGIVLLQIFSLVILLFFMNSPLSSVVQSSHLVQKFLPFGIANTILNILLNVFFVPQFGLIAAALAMLTTEVTGLLINICFTLLLYKKRS